MMDERTAHIDLIIAFDKFKEITGKTETTIDTGTRRVQLSMIESMPNFKKAQQTEKVTKE